MYPILLTFDLEYWFESLSIQKYLVGKEKDLLAPFIERLLKLLAETNSSATFFITKKVLEQEPLVIKNIFNHGHEIAIHSVDHQPLWVKNQAVFDQEIKELIKEVAILIGKKPVGHRAVNFSLDKSTFWALGVLKDNGLKYDSSILPLSIKPNFFQVNNFPEIKVFSGGLYLRLMPWCLFKILLKAKLKKSFACLYFHAFDFMEGKPEIKMPVWKKFIKYYNTKNTWYKLEYILNNYNCSSIEKYLHENPSH